MTVQFNFASFVSPSIIIKSPASNSFEIVNKYQFMSIEKEFNHVSLLMIKYIDDNKYYIYQSNSGNNQQFTFQE